MKGKIQELWDDAQSNPGTEVPMGDVVVCDICTEDYTDRPDSGGFIAGSYAYCPACAPKGYADHKRFNELDHIRARCDEGQSFADFVRNYRGPNAYIKISGIL